MADDADVYISVKRHFECNYQGESFGRYAGETPKQAAKKAFTRIIQKYNIPTDQDTQFCIRECARNSKHRLFHYIGRRIMLRNPVPVQIGGSVVTYKHKNKVRKDKLRLIND